MPPKTLVSVGVGMILFAVAAFWMAAHCMETRSLEPVNSAVTLEAGKVQTVDFEINLREEYGVWLDADYSIDDWTEGKCNSGQLREMDWKVYRLGKAGTRDIKLWASSEEIRRQGELPYGFRGSPGKYELEWKVPEAATCLSARHPRLRVWTDASDYETIFVLICLTSMVIVVAGAGAILRAMFLYLSGILSRKDSLRIFPEIATRNVIPLRRHRPMPPIRILPDFRTAWFCILGVQTVVLCLYLTAGGWRSKGLLVDFKGERAVGMEKSPWTDPVSVYLDARRGFLVNGQVVNREELQEKLKEKLGRQMVWAVYFEADRDCLYMDAAYAIETIQGLGAKLIWITPKTREEWKQRGIS